TNTSTACCGLANLQAPEAGVVLAAGVFFTVGRCAATKNGAHRHAQTIARRMQRSLGKFLSTDNLIVCIPDLHSGIRVLYLRRPPPPRLKPPPARLKPPLRDPMLEAPRLLPDRVFEPLYPLEPPPKASRFPPPLRERSRLPMRSDPPPAARLPTLAPSERLLPPARLLRPVPAPRLLDRLPPCRPTCCRALAWRFASESPRAVPPNLSAVARSRYGAPPRCCGLCCHLLPAPPRSPPRTG